MLSLTPQPHSATPLPAIMSPLTYKPSPASLWLWLWLQGEGQSLQRPPFVPSGAQASGRVGKRLGLEEFLETGSGLSLAWQGVQPGLSLLRGHLESGAPASSLISDHIRSQALPVSSPQSPPSA